MTLNNSECQWFDCEEAPSHSVRKRKFGGIIVCAEHAKKYMGKLGHDHVPYVVESLNNKEATQ